MSDRISTYDDELLRAAGLHPEAAAGPHGSPERFADGARYRIEIPSVEGPRSLAAVLDAAHRHDVPVTRVSQGSGAAVDVPLDVYIEAPDDIGGFVRYHDLAEIVRVAAPVYVKLGLRNAPLIYPSGTHLDQTAATLCLERVRRARIALDILARNRVTDPASAPRAAGLAIPAVPGQLSEVND